MSDSAELAHQVLVNVADFVRKLPADQLADVASGAARIGVIPKGARVVLPSAPKVLELPLPAAEIERTMRDIGLRAAARQYLDDFGMKADQLKLLAKELKIAPGRSMALTKERIVEEVVGRVEDAAAASRVGGGR